MTSVKESKTKPSASDFILGKELGQGNFSRVFMATHKPTQEVFAVKVIEKARIMRMKIRHPNIFNEVNMEKTALNMLRHPNIIRLYHTFQDGNNLYYLMEYIANGELWDYLNFEGKQIGCSEQQAKFYAADIVSALEYMAKRHIVHRDLKPENMIVSKQDDHLRIVDFGTAKNLSDISLNGPNFVGTPEYMSPETIENQSVDNTSDLWALGCIIYQLLTGETPFQGGSPYLTFLRVKAGAYDLPEFLSESAKDLIQMLLQKNSTDRPSFDNIKGHAFFQGINFEQHMEARCPALDPEDIFVRQAAHDIAEYAKSEGSMDKPPVFNQPLTSKQRSHLMHILNRMQVLHHQKVYPQFFPTPAAGRCLYATKRGYVGYVHGMQNKWDKSFRFVHLNGPQLGKNCHGEDDTQGLKWQEEIEAFKKVLSTVNDLQPAFLVFSGNMTQATPDQKGYAAQVASFQTTLNEALDSNIRVVFVPGSHDVGMASNQLSEACLQQYVNYFGDDYYSFWVGGVKCIVLNSNLLVQRDAMPERTLAQEQWLQDELEHGSLCSHHLCVFSHHPIVIQSEDEDLLAGSRETLPGNNDTLENHVVSQQDRARYANMLAEAKVKGVFSSWAHASTSKTVPWCATTKGEEEEATETPCTFVLTNSLGEHCPSTLSINPIMHNIRVEQEGLHVESHPLIKN